MRPTWKRGTRRRAGARQGEPAGGEATDLEKLRRLVIAPEQQRLERLEERPAPTADTIGSVLPEAVALTTERRREALSLAIEPVMTTALRKFARREADLFGEILSPAIGAAVRKAVADAVAVILRRFDAALERSLSFQGVRWRMEAWRSGRPLAEVVLSRTLVYRVEEVFLIHPGTGLVLDYLVAHGAGVKDPDQVAAMLEAIDAFVREAFRPQPPTVHLTHVEVGDLMVWIDRDASLATAAVVRGVAPREFADLLHETRERIYLTHRADLARFESDISPFASARPTLERCLLAQYRPPRRRAHIWLAVASALFVLLCVAFLVRNRERAAEEARLLAAYAETLGAQPGMFLTSVERSRGRVQIVGFRDPLADPPAEVLSHRGLPPARLHFEPFYSLDPRIVERRARRSLDPPEGVTLALASGTLRATGTAPRSWIERARLLAPALPGIERYDESELRAEEQIEALRAATATLEGVEILFARGSSDVTADAALRRAGTRSRQVIEAATMARLPVCITVTGRTDPTGSEARNWTLSEKRAIRVAEELGARGIGRTYLRPVGAGVSRAADTTRHDRSVTFRVDLGRRDAGCAEAR